MKPAPFTYHRAETVDDATRLLDDENGFVRALAGGQSLLPMVNLRLAPVDKLVDIGRIKAMKQAEEGKDGIRYGALLTHAAFEDRRVPDGSNGLLPFVGSLIAFRAIRTRGTIGGAIALADPAADWLTTVIALEATIHVAGPHGKRAVPAEQFVVGPYMTDLQTGEIIETIEIPRRPKSERWGHAKVARKVGEYAESMAIALHDPQAGTARVVAGAVDGAPLVLREAARALAAGKPLDAIAAVTRDEIAGSERGFSQTKIHLHSNICLRAIRKLTES
jgi:carbon-monoxide dehydrogenase medium subunit